MKTLRMHRAAALLVITALLMAGCAASPGNVPQTNITASGIDGSAVKLAASPTNEDLSKGISVSGTASIQVKPDTASFTIGVETSDADAAKARAANDAAMQKVFDALKAQGIAEVDLQTVNYAIYARYNDSGTKITGYTVNNQVQVRVRDLDKLGDVLGAAGTAGANTAAGITFDISDRTAAYNQALEQAMAKAQTRAKVIADACGVKLGAATVINENSNYSGPVTREGAMAAGAKEDSVSVSAGQLEVNASVSVSFAIEQ